MNTLVLGRRGLGKTTLALWRARQLNDHVVAWSPGAEFRKFPANLRTTEREEVFEFLDDADDDEPYLVEYIADGDLNDNFRKFAIMLWQFDDLVFIVDESNEIQSFSVVNPVLSTYIRRAPRREKGDHNPVDIIQTCHFPVDLHRVSFGLGDDAWIFRLTRERDLMRIRAELGDKIADAVEHARTPEDMPPGRDVIHANITTRQFEVIEDPAFWNIKQEPEDDEEEEEEEEELEYA